MTLVTGQQIGKELLKKLGIDYKGVTEIVLTIRPNEGVTMQITRMIKKSEVEIWADVFEKHDTRRFKEITSIYELNDDEKNKQE